MHYAATGFKETTANCSAIPALTCSTGLSPKFEESVQTTGANHISPDRGRAVFTITCSRCNQPIKLPDEALGKTISCPKCKELILIPPEPVKSTGELSTFFGGSKTDPADDDE
jgi:hypothetical protein